MQLLVGLGNPGDEYVDTRHNVGFRVVQEIAERHGIGPWLSRFHGVAARGKIDQEPVLLLLPQTYMNDSGRAVAEAARFFKISSSDVTVFHDEKDFAAGKVRLKFGGTTDAGHNGLISISSHIGHDYRRVRIGIGRPEKGGLHGHVLSNFSKDEQPRLQALLTTISDNVDLLVRREDSRFQNKVHLAMVAKGFGEPDGSGPDQG